MWDEGNLVACMTQQSILRPKSELMKSSIWDAFRAGPWSEDKPPLYQSLQRLPAY
jgi:hypothetical protein